MLNIMANRLQLEGHEYASCNRFGIEPYFKNFVDECAYTLGDDDDGSFGQFHPKADT